MRQPTTIQKRSSSTLTDVWHAYGLLFIEGASVPRAVQASQVQPVGDRWSPTARDTNGDRQSKFESSTRRRLADAEKAPPPRSMRENDRHLNLAAPTQNFQRHVIAVAMDPQIDA